MIYHLSSTRLGTLSKANCTNQLCTHEQKRTILTSAKANCSHTFISEKVKVKSFKVVAFYDDSPLRTWLLISSICIHICYM
mmetsp:Transcript_14775/g.26632  ORF Transcript_14775/g.26632 Transcript_14775/m.26632 type:complete len:81 (-) Transcript_14775:1112-1354(-)